MKVSEASCVDTSDGDPVRVIVDPEAPPAVTVPWSAVRVTDTRSASTSVTLIRFVPVKLNGLSSAVVTDVGADNTGASSTAVTVIAMVASAPSFCNVAVSTVWTVMEAGPL